MAERNGKLVAGGGPEVGAAGSGFSAGHAVLEALELFQARLVEAGLHPADGLKVVLPERFFDTLICAATHRVSMGRLVTSLFPAPPHETILNLSGGPVVVRRAIPYQPRGGTFTFTADPKLRPGEMRWVPRPYRPTPETTVHAETPSQNKQLLEQSPRPPSSIMCDGAEMGPDGPVKTHEPHSISTPCPGPFMKTVDRLASVMGREIGERTNRFVMDMHAGIPPKPAVKRVNSPNFNERTAQVDVLLLHHTGGTSTAGAVLHLCDPSPNGGTPVSAHYVVSPEGFVWQLVDDDKRAWHAGKCELRGVPTDMNSRSIGIELVNPGDGKTPFTEAQYGATRQLVAHLQARYAVPWENVLGHRDVAVPKGRKTDPADNFEWHRVLPHEESLRRGLLQSST